MKNYLSYLLLLPFVLVSIAHLVFCFQENKKYTDKTKLYLMPLLLVYYLIAQGITGGAFAWFIVGALIFSTLGDFFLLKNTTQRIICGIAGFFLAHVCYICLAAGKIDFGNFFIMRNIITAIVYIVIFIVIALYLKSQKCEYYYIVILYTAIISLMSFFFTLICVNSFSRTTFLMALGGLTFMSSDFILCHQMFLKKPIPHSRFWVMLTYIVAQALIVLTSMA